MKELEETKDVIVSPSTIDDDIFVRKWTWIIFFISVAVSITTYFIEENSSFSFFAIIGAVFGYFILSLLIGAFAEGINALLRWRAFRKKKWISWSVGGVFIIVSLKIVSFFIVRL